MIQRLLALFLLGSIFFTFPGLSATAQDEAQSNHIVVAMSSFESLNPATVSRFDVDKKDLLENLFVGLTRFDARRGVVSPMLATNWEVSDNGLTWTFYLRDDVQWMEVVDGDANIIRAVTAQDVVYTVQRSCDPNQETPVVNSNFAIIAGCQAMLERRDYWTIDQADLDANIGAHAIDDTTVEFNLLWPASYFLTLTSLPEFRPLPAERASNGTFPLGTNLATSGPWLVTEWTSQQMILQANPEWPIEREGNLDEVEIVFDLAPETVANRLVTGTLDMARVDVGTAQQIGFANPDLVQTTEGQPLDLIGFSFENTILGDPAVRRALALAIDRDAIAQEFTSLTGTIYEPTTRFIPLNVIATSTAPGSQFDVNQAQNTLAQAGYPNCTNFPARLSLAVADDAYSITLGEMILTQWQTNLGCAEGSFELAIISRQLLNDNVHQTLDSEATARYSMWLVTWASDYPDANAWLYDALHCQWGYLRVGRGCDQNDGLLDQAGQDLDVVARSQAYTQVEASFFGFNGSFPVIPLMITGEQWVTQAWLDNVPRYGAFQFDRWLLVQED